MVASANPPGLGAPLAVQHLVRSTGPPELASVLEACLVAQWTATPLAGESVGLGGFYKYPAALRPSAARELLRILPAGTLLDPFCGSGGSLLEALVTGRRAVGNDASPLALFVALHQTHRPGVERVDRMRRRAREVASEVRAQRKAAFAAAETAAEAAAQAAAEAEARGELAPAARPRARGGRQLQWQALAAAVRSAEAEEAEAYGAGTAAGQAPTPLWFCLASAMQRAEFDKTEPPSLLVQTVDAYCDAVLRLSSAAPLALPPPVLLHSDARSLQPSALPWGLVDAVLTSPPYPGVYDYLSLAREERTRLAMKGLPGRSRKTRGVRSAGGGTETGPTLMGLEQVLYMSNY